MHLNENTYRFSYVKRNEFKRCLFNFQFSLALVNLNSYFNSISVFFSKDEPFVVDLLDSVKKKTVGLNVEVINRLKTTDHHATTTTTCHLNIVSSVWVFLFVT